MRAKTKPVPVQTAAKVTIVGMACLTLLSPLNFALPASAADTSSKATAARQKAQDARMQKKRAAHSLLNPPMKAALDTTHKFPPPQASPDPTVEVASGVPTAPSAQTNAHAKELLKEGARQHRAGNLQDAERLFGQAIAADPHNADGFFNLGALAEGRGDYLAALTNYRAGLNIRPNDRDLKDAVSAMESKLAVASPVTFPNSFGTEHYVANNGFRYPNRMFSSPDPSVTISSQPLLNVNQPDDPTLQQYVYEPPVETTPVNGTFQLHGSQNATTGSAPTTLSGNTGNWSAPVQAHSNRGRTAARVAGVTVGALLGIGLSAALRGGGGGLHCPRCRLLGF